MLFRVRPKNSPSIRRRASAFALLSLLILLSPLYAGKIQCKWSGVKNIVAVADIHGAYENFVKILKGTGLIDEDLNWIGERTHLVQLGDILDRGSGAKDTFDLLMKLEKQAEEAGGMVHVLIGNHEEANITGIVFDQAGYLIPGQLVSFLPQGYIYKKERDIRAKFGPVDGSDGQLRAKLESFWKKEIDKAQQKMPGENRTRDEYTKNFYREYGKWLLTKNIVIKINENIFVHGGLSDVDFFLERNLETLNNEARREFRVVANWATGAFSGVLPTSFKYLMQPQAPHWYRGWARDPEDGNSATLKRVLANYKAKHMIIGHTVRDVEYIETRNLDRFGRQVWAIDVGISRFFNDQLFALIIEKTEQGSKFSPWWGEDEKK
jgi:hypothetical protein